MWIFLLISNVSTLLPGSSSGLSRQEMIYNKEKLLSLGGTHAGIQKWKHKLEEAKEQESFPVKP